MKKILAGLLALMLIFSLFGCGQTPPTPTEPPTEPPVADAYTEAAASLRDAQNLKVELTTKKEITTLGGEFSSVSQQELILTGIGTDAFTASLSEDLEIGELEDKFTECFADDVLYVNVYDIGYFQGEMSAEDFQGRFAPAVLLDEDLYAEVSSQESASGEKLTFSDPTGPEAWALPEGAKFVSASGTAEINSDGSLEKTVYAIDYIYGATTVSVEVTAQAQIYDGAAVTAPQNPYQYNKIESVDVPRLYDTAIMYLCSSPVVSSTISQSIASQAAGYSQTEQIQMHYTGMNESLMSSIEKTVSYADVSGASDSHTMKEEFRDGQYTISENGGEAVPQTGITEEAMAEYLRRYYYGDMVPSLDYITSAKREEVNGLICLEMELNPDWGKKTSQLICYNIFQDANFLDNLATDYKTTTGAYSVVLDPVTGFPVAADALYMGAHTIDGQNYILMQEVAQNYQLADIGTYVELTGEMPAETAPAEQATPLLYRVTGADGQEMYLMGTIHVGDTKTGFLPDEVYDAFDACDALAVEADVEAFEEQVEDDPQLAMKLGQLYVTTDGKTMKDKLGEDAYETARRLMWASGDYDSNMEYMKPFVWTSSIENFYLTLGGLRAEKGMDLRLMKRAREQDKKILEVESSMFQFEMLSGFSAELQMMLLEETLDSNALEYCDGVQELYDLWCTGDEAALREMLKDDISELTEEELALYNEYNDAMIVDRNEGMLDVAISYLESGDTVFYAVGLAHLLQENGLVDTLREAGYTVEQVIYS